MEGRLSEKSFGEILGELYQFNISGVLSLSWDELWKLIYFEDGAIKNIISNQEEENLLEFLLSLEAITESQFNEIQNQLENASIYAALRDSSILSEEELNNYNEMLGKGVLYSLFNWLSGAYTFNEMKIKNKDYFHSSFIIPELILEGVKRINDYQIIEFRLGSLNEMVSLSDKFFLQAKDLPLTPSETFIISRIDNKTSIKEIIEMTMLDAEEVCRAIFALKCLGYLEFQEPKEDEPPEIIEKPTRSYEEYRFIENVKAFAEKLPSLEEYEILGLDRSFDLDSLRINFQELVLKYDPESYSYVRFGEIKNILKLIHKRIIQAYIRLSATSIGKPPLAKIPSIAEMEKRRFFSMTADFTASSLLPSDSKQKAQELFKIAKNYAQQDDYYQAVQHCQEALNLDDTIPDFYLFMASIYSEFPRFYDKAVNSFETYLKLKPTNVEARIKLVKLFIKAADFVKASKELKTITSLEPENAEARKLMSLLPVVK